MTASAHLRQISIRPPTVAGSFYPRDAVQLHKMLDEFLDDKSADLRPPKAIIAPHAGYIYSGPIAGSIYASVAQLKKQITRVVLLGPAHRSYIKSVALTRDTHFATPLGNIALDTVILKKLATHPFVDFLDGAYTQEHSLEVHLPFLQKTLNEFTLVPLLVGDVEADQVALLLDELWGGDETLIVVSSDLSHYLDYETALKTDGDTTKLIEQLDYKYIDSQRACGCVPINGLLKLARKKNFHIQTVDVRNSGDTSGDKDRVVGYGAYALFENHILVRQDEEAIFSVMRKSIQQGLEKGSAFEPDVQNYAPHLREKYAVFVTLKMDGKLRGCVGTTEAYAPLIKTVAHYAYAAAFSDPRFQPLAKHEYDRIKLNLSILTPAVPIKFRNEQHLLDQLKQNEDGLILTKDNNRATFLPSVWETMESKRKFLYELKRKAGIDSSETPQKAWRYKAQYYSEPEHRV